MRIPVLLAAVCRVGSLLPGPSTAGGRVTRRATLFAPCLVVISQLPSPSLAITSLGYMDDAGVKSYSQVQRAWEKSATMSQREIILAARGVSMGKSANESEKSKKRRAMGGCHDELFRRRAGYAKEVDCNARVLGGDVSFMLEIIDAAAAPS